ncbi:MAG: heavy-metal-associated domain-containing protein [Gammaproteobacteria bacterium]|nr:MAG: heavy-metal-associated domain-containing protein [Gammaproteobacteria bacterium]
MARSLLLFYILTVFSVNVFAVEQQTIEIEVTGMTCPFCVYGTEKKLQKLDGVENVDVSLDKKKARIVMKEGKTADIDAIKKAITDAGFTAGKASINGKPANK